MPAKTVTYGTRGLKLLTAAEYQTSLEDLLGVTTDYAARVVNDSYLGKFPNNSKTQISDSHADKYLDNAQEIASWAVANNKPFSCTDTSSCPQKFVSEFLLKAFRRPADSTESAAYTALFTTYGAKGGMTAALTAALSSPQFLYRSEIGVPIRDAVSAGITTGTPNKLAQADQSAYVLTPYEYASALAYSLTGSTPDDTLLAAAKAGTLTTDAQIQAQVTRLLDTNRGKAQVGRFAGIWFNTDSVMNETRDATAYPKFTTSVQRAMAQEVREVFKNIFYDSSASFSELYDANYTFANKELADYYGISGPTGSSFVKVSNLDKRGGITTTGAFLVANAHPDRSSPIQRAVRVRELMLCQHIDPPPNNLAADRTALQMKVEELNKAGTLTTRQFYEINTDHSSCAGCHAKIINPLFGTEDFDQMGLWRSTQLGATGATLNIDDSGVLMGLENPNDGQSVNFNGAKGLGKAIAKLDVTKACFVEKSFRFLINRPYDPATRDENEPLLSDAEKADYKCVASQAKAAMTSGNNSPRAVFNKLGTSDLLRYRK